MKTTKKTRSDVLRSKIPGDNKTERFHHFIPKGGAKIHCIDLHHQRI